MREYEVWQQTSGRLKGKGEDRETENDCVDLISKSNMQSEHVVQIQHSGEAFNILCKGSGEEKPFSE